MAPLYLVDYEADDIIGTLLARFGEGRPAIIVTRDKDLGQLLRAGDTLWDFAADTCASREDVHAKFGVTPEQLPDLLALAGDAVDNIPGAPGIGVKTAARLLGEFGSLDHLLQIPEAVVTAGIRGGARLRDILIKQHDQLKVYRQITGIKCDVPMEVSAQELALTPSDPAELAAFFDEMQFGQRIRERVAGLQSS